MLNRRDFLLGAASTACAAGLPGRLAAAGATPNILILITDEQSANAASYRMGTRYLRTPNMDSVAAKGRIYTRAYCSNPLCVPSRTSMFTGQYPTVTGVMDNDAVKTMHLDTQRFPMMGTMFDAAGYETAYFGKWHIPCDEKNHKLHGFATIETKMVDTETAANAADFLHRRHASPFLAVASFLNPHNITQWSRGQNLPLGNIDQPPPADRCPPLRANHAPQKNEPDIMTLMRRSYESAPMFPVGEYTAAKWRQYEWAYYRLIEKVDAQIGIVLQALRSSGHERDTLVVMLADHGDCQGAHGWDQKTVLYEEATRVPLVLSWPGMIPVGKANCLANTGVDLIPTVCDFAGFRVPSGLPGISLKDPFFRRRRYVVVSNKMAQGAPVDGRLPSPTGRMVRSLRYSYCAYSEGIHRESLVDLQTDPGEMINLAGDPRFRMVLEEHRAMLAEWCSETHDTFNVPKG